MRKTRRIVKQAAVVSMSALMATSAMPATAIPFLRGANGIVQVYAADAAYEGWNLSGGYSVGQNYGQSLGLSVMTDLTYTEGTSSIEGVSYPGYLSNGTNAAVGADNIPTSSAVVLKPERSGDLTVALKVNKGRTFTLVGEDGTILDTVDNSAGTSSKYETKTFSLEAGKTYYMCVPKNKLFIYGMTWSAEKVTESVDFTNGLKVGENYHGFSVFTDWAVAADKETGAPASQEVEGVTYSPFVNAPGNPTYDENGIPNGGGALKFTAEEDGSIDLAVKINKGKTYKFVDETGTEVDKIVNSGTSSLYKEVSYDVKAGKTYYAYVEGSKISVFKAVATKGTKNAWVAWEDVATPEIKSVTVNEDGGFDVNFSAQIDKYAGAEYVRISMLEDGKEVSTKTVKAASVDTVSFTPLWSGNYTFKAVAVRTGEPNKESEVAAYNDYVMAVRKPVITWAQNKGNGSVYLDWVNIADADSYAIGYRAAGSDAEYTMVDSALPATQGNYTLTGLTAGENYEIVIRATRNSDGFVATATKEIAVTDTADQQWYVATIGSAQQTKGTLTTEAGAVTDINMASGDTAAVKQNLMEADSIANTKGTIELLTSDSGKISDDEDGFSYYFTKIDPNTENFKMGATFEVTASAADNQTGFGIIAADALGINVWGEPGYTNKYFNYAGAMMYSHKQANPVLRTVKGYTSADTSSNDGVERVVTGNKFTEVKSDFTPGSTYTFTLEKTDKGYTATCNGQTIELEDNSFTSVQEDGTVAIGIAVSRKVSAKVSDVRFEKSASKGITSAADKDAKVKPEGRIYSTNTCSSSEYEYIYVPNCDGKITVSGPAGTVVENKAVKANDVVRVNVPITEGVNQIQSVFTPDASENITSTAPITETTNVSCVRYGVEGQTIIVSADGTADGKGTEESPLDLDTATKYAQPGQTIFLKNGIYNRPIKIQRSVSGTADKPITMVAESVSTDGTDGVVFQGAGLTVSGSYWHIYGLYVKDAQSVGIQICGNNNVIEMCTVNHASNTGIQISRDGKTDNTAGRVGRLWPSDNLIKNCESFDNCDSGRNDADGFAAKLTCGEGNKFYGCISHHNIDDGWDLYAKSVSGEIGAVTIENCVAYNNGWLSFEDDNRDYGEGNGFKLGGGQLKGGHTLINSVSFDNHAKGITSNSCPDCRIINSISYNNSVEGASYNVGLNTKESNVKAWEVSGLISINKKDNTTQEDLIPFSLLNENNFFYNGENSYNSKGVQATDEWFESAVFTAPTRNADGTINLHGYTVLNDKAPANAGARLDVTSDAAKSVAPAKTEVVQGDTEIVEDELMVMAETTTPQVKVGDKIVVKASAIGGSKEGYTYTFLNGNTEIASGSSDTLEWTANKSGTVNIKVQVKDSEGNIATSDVVEVVVEEVVEPLTVTAKASTTNVLEGNKVTVTAKAAGGQGEYTYKFLVYTPATKKWETVQESESATCEWTAKGSGARHFYVEATDSEGTVVRSKAYGVTIATRPTLTAKISTSKVATGGKVTVTATASQGSGSYTYRYIMYNPSTKAWTQLQGFSAKNTYTWTATGTGARHLYVEVKDSNGTVTRSKAFGVTVASKPTVTAKLSTSKVAAGKTVTVTATAAQGSGKYTYRYVMYNPATKAWTQLQGYSNKNTYTWKATGTGARHIYVDVKDSNGTITRSNAFGVTVTK